MLLVHPRLVAGSTVTTTPATLRSRKLGSILGLVVADAIAAVTGQIAGAIHGVDVIPVEWIDRLALRDRVLELAEGVVRGGVGTRG